MGVTLMFELTFEPSSLTEIAMIPSHAIARSMTTLEVDPGGLTPGPKQLNEWS
jgi:hypothetical protein